MDNETAFETLCLLMNRKPSETTWEDIIDDVLLMAEFMKITTSAAVNDQMPIALLKTMREVSKSFT